MTLIIGDHTSKVNKPITVRLVGVEYQMVRPKALLTVAMAKEAKEAKEVDSDDENGMSRAVALYQDWLDLACPEETESIIARLSDQSDALEFTHLAELMKAMSTFDTPKAGGNPPT